MPPAATRKNRRGTRPAWTAGVIKTSAIVDLEPGNYLQLSAVRGGFRLKCRPSAAQIPHFITIWIADQVRGGNPFKKYTPFDFDVSREPVGVQVEGARLLLCRDNALQIEVVRADFRLTVTGFDTRRDIRVRTHP